MYIDYLMLTDLQDSIHKKTPKSSLSERQMDTYMKCYEPSSCGCKRDDRTWIFSNKLTPRLAAARLMARLPEGVCTRPWHNVLRKVRALRKTELPAGSEGSGGSATSQEFFPCSAVGKQCKQNGEPCTTQQYLTILLQKEM